MDDLATALEAFLGEHRHCGDLDGGVKDLGPGAYSVWMCCTCGARLARREAEGR